MITNTIHLTELESPVQTINARVELYKGSALARVCDCGDILREFTVDRTGEGKFFGFGICQQLSATLIGINERLDFDRVEAAFGVKGNFLYPFPVFYITEIPKLNEEDETLSIVAADALYKASDYTVNELLVPASYSIKTFAEACGSLLGLPVRIDAAAASSFETFFSAGANFSGSETIREALNAVAEATQTIYYINGNWELYFKRLKINENPVTTIERTKYFELSDDGARQLAGIVHTTELGDNLEPTITLEGETQYIRDNPFWEMRTDAAALVDAAQKVVEGTTINQFNCEWFGNYLLEIGDKIELITKKNLTLVSYLLSDAITYDGALSQVCGWAYDNNDSETIANPTNLGDALNMTFARVDKVKQEITLLAQESDGLNEKFAELKLTTDGLSGTFERTTERVAALEGDSATKEELEGAIEKLSSDFKLDAIEGLLTFQKKTEANGVSQVSGTGFKFSADGLEINKTDAPTSTLIDETGMIVSDNSTEVLVANDSGVSAKNLHATTYIYIGANSRLETYQNGSEERTACFWVGR